MKSYFPLHELTLEDLRSTTNRTKIEEFDDYTFVVFKAFNFNPGDDPLDTINTNFIIFKNVLITARLKRVYSIVDTLAEVQKRPRLMKAGPAYLVYRIMDRIVDRIIPFVEEFDDALDTIQTKIFEEFDDEISGVIFEKKTFVAQLRRRVGPQRELIGQLSSREHRFINAKTRAYFRDVHDQLIRIWDILETYRDILQGAMDSYLTQVSNRMNTVMKTLSIVATIMLPLGFLTGLYGTNFEILPGSKSPIGFWAFCLVLLVLAGLMLFGFKKKKWL